MKTIRLDSPIAPFAFLGLGLVMNQLTHGTDFWLFRIVEMALFAMGLLTALVSYSSRLKYVVVGLCLLGALVSGSELLRPSDRSTVDGTDGGATRTMSQEDGSYGGYDYDYDYDHGYDHDEWDGSTGGVGYGTNQLECYHCKGSGRCSDCSGTGRVAYEKYGIDLGGGSSTYHEYHRCPLCEGQGSCIYCDGRGYVLL